MGVVSFRLGDEDDARLRQAGVNPGALAKRLVEAEARRLAVRRTFAELARLRRKPTVSAVDMLRALRDAR